VDSTIIIVFVFALILFVVAILGISHKLRKANQKSKEELNILDKAFEKLKTDIREYEQSILKSNSTSIPEALEKLYNRAKTKYEVLWDNYLASKNIYATENSHSYTLMFCGVSDTDFWYEFEYEYDDDVLQFNFFEKFIDEELYKNIEKAIEEGKNRSGFREYSYKDVTSDVDKLQGRFDYYKKIEESRINFAGKHISLSNIQYFKVEGSEQYISEVSGGGVNLRGAVAGGLLGGGAAAVIGSQLGTETKTKVVKKDDRKVVIVYSKNDKLKVLNSESYDIEATVRALRKLIPKKEESVFIGNKTVNNKTVRNKTVKGDSNSNFDDIKKFKELLDNGIITQEEFDAKKKQLLGL